MKLSVNLISFTDAPTDTGHPAETKTETVTADGSETVPGNPGCDASPAGGAVVISLLGLGVFAVARKKKEE